MNPVGDADMRPQLFNGEGGIDETLEQQNGLGDRKGGKSGFPGRNL